jgi:hypothetical protein
MGNLGIAGSLGESFPKVLANNSGPYKSSITILRTIINGIKGIVLLQIIADLLRLLRRTAIDVKRD